MADTLPEFVSTFDGSESREVIVPFGQEEFTSDLTQFMPAEDDKKDEYNLLDL